jgi:hypothetical protein
MNTSSDVSRFPRDSGPLTFAGTRAQGRARLFICGQRLCEFERDLELIAESGSRER